jgi:hypothetical protein
MAKLFSIRATVVLSAALLAFCLGAALAPGLYVSVTSGSSSRSSTGTISWGLLSSSITTTSQPAAPTDGTKTILNMPGPTAAAFAVFIVAALLALTAGAAVLVCGERARVIAFWSIAFMPVFLIAGIVLSNIIFLDAFNSAANLSLVSIGSAVVISMPGRSVASTGVSLAVALIIGLFRWQRNDSPSHFGGLSNLSSCWPDKHFAPPPVPASFAPAFAPSTSNPILVVVKGSALAN